MRRNKKDKDDLLGTLGESFHTAFRKGCDGGGSSDVWRAISKMDKAQWGNALEWALWCIEESGYVIRKKKP